VRRVALLDPSQRPLRLLPLHARCRVVPPRRRTVTPRLPDCRPGFRPKTERNHVALTAPAGATSRAGQGRKLVEVVASPHCDIPETIMPRTAEECGRSTAGNRLSDPSCATLARCTGAAGEGRKLAAPVGLFWGQRR
jgi:hypothetical protein